VVFGRVPYRAISWMVAIVVGLAVPITQLRIANVVKTCCCPDAAQCHCPKPKPGSDDNTSMKTCHDMSQIVVSADAPSCALVRGDVIPTSSAQSEIQFACLPRPHAAPGPAEPFGPS